MLCGHDNPPKERIDYINAGFDACEKFEDVHWNTLTDEQRIAMGCKKKGDYWSAPDSKFGGFRYDTN
jgi:hypothetical protein